MGIFVNKNENIVKWDIDGEVIEIYNEHILYAFEHGKTMLMIKEKYDTTDTGFCAYDRGGKVIFSYIYKSDNVILKDAAIKINGIIVAVDYDEEKRSYIVLNENNGTRTLLIYDKDGNFMSEIKSPEEYRFISLKNDRGNILVVARGISNKTRDSFGRNDWSFKINSDNFFVEKNSIVS